MQDNNYFQIAEQSNQKLFKITTAHLDMFLSMLITKNQNRTIQMLKNLSKFLHYIDTEEMSKDVVFNARYFLLCKLLRYVLVDGLPVERAIPLVNGTAYDQEIKRCIESIEHGPDISNEYLEVVGRYIDTRLKYLYLWQNSDNLYNLAVQLRSDTVSDIERTCIESEQMLEGMYNTIRRQKSRPSHAEGYTIQNEDWFQKVRSEHEASLKPGSKIRTGVRYLNDMLDGGWQRSRYYLIIMETGKGKSAFGLMALLWSVMYNRGIETMDPTKRPCVLHVSQENLPGQTLRRELSFIYGRDINISNLTQEDLAQIREMKNRLYGHPDDPDTVWYVTYYFPANTCTPPDIYSLIEQTETQYGVEIIGVINDYSKKLATHRKGIQDERNRLGAIVDDCKSIASMHNIFWLDFMQLRRYSIERVQQYAQNNQLGQIGDLEKTDIGESSLMIDNSDAVFIMTREPDEAGNLYMGIKSGKFRDLSGDSKIKSFYQPFYANSNIRLVEDVDAPIPAGKIYQDNTGYVRSENFNGANDRILENAKSLPDFAGPESQNPSRYQPPRVVFNQ